VSGREDRGRRDERAGAEGELRCEQQRDLGVRFAIRSTAGDGADGRDERSDEQGCGEQWSKKETAHGNSRMRTVGSHKGSV
jgi:hypothetical protein